MQQILDLIKKHKTKLYAGLLVLIGALGGNVDRVDKWVKTILYVITPTAVVVEEENTQVSP